MTEGSRNTIDSARPCAAKAASRIVGSATRARSSTFENTTMLPTSAGFNISASKRKETGEIAPPSGIHPPAVPLSNCRGVCTANGIGRMRWRAASTAESPANSCAVAGSKIPSDCRSRESKSASPALTRSSRCPQPVFIDEIVVLHVSRLGSWDTCDPAR